tara:strand:- start:1169 stop:1354 length:186 start_codon:yes stop_codon:yes gene_type:complete
MSGPDIVSPHISGYIYKLKIAQCLNTKILKSDVDVKKTQLIIPPTASPTSEAIQCVSIASD